MFLPLMSESKTETCRELGRRLKGAREAAGITQDQLGTACGAHTSTLSMIERGLRWPSVPMLLRLVAALGMPVIECRPTEGRLTSGEGIMTLESRATLREISQVLELIRVGALRLHAPKMEITESFQEVVPLKLPEGA